MSRSKVLHRGQLMDESQSLDLQKRSGSGEELGSIASLCETHDSGSNHTDGYNLDPARHRIRLAQAVHTAEYNEEVLLHQFRTEIRPPLTIVQKEQIRQIPRQLNFFLSDREQEQDDSMILGIEMLIMSGVILLFIAAAFAVCQTNNLKM